jgi:hypothetical protein
VRSGVRSSAPLRVTNRTHRGETFGAGAQVLPSGSAAAGFSKSGLSIRHKWGVVSAKPAASRCALATARGAPSLPYGVIDAENRQVGFCGTALSPCFGPASFLSFELGHMFESLQNRTTALARDGLKVRRLIVSCKKLLSERGEAAGVSLAKVTLDLYTNLDKKEQARFFAALLAEFSPDPMRVLAASKAYAEERSAANLAQLCIAAEPPRQELLRRLNRAPGGTAAILRLRERLLELKREQRELEAVDWDLLHLLSSWFNPGFLQIVRVDWRTPAYLLEQIIAHEAVHEIRGWNDLRRRLESDRRCFAFFHPALPSEPLIFVEVALMDRMADAVGSLLDAQSTSDTSSRATTAVFYSGSSVEIVGEFWLG